MNIQHSLPLLIRTRTRIRLSSVVPLLNINTLVLIFLLMIMCATLYIRAIPHHEPDVDDPLYPLKVPLVMLIGVIVAVTFKGM